MLKFKKIRGFTLVEIVLVIGLLGIIFGGMILLLNPVHQLKKGRDAERKSDLKTIQSAVELYRADNNSYPLFSGGGTGWAPATSMILNTGGITYLGEIPKGPSGSNCDYVWATNGSVYTIFTNLENESDSDALTTKPTPPYRPGGGTFSTNNITATWTSGSCPGTYNYWVNSP